MWSILLLLLSSSCIYAYNDQGKNTDSQGTCIDDDHLVDAFRKSYDDFSMKILLATTDQKPYNIVLSPHMVYITLMAIMEGTDEQTKNQLSKLLQAPKDFCSRQKNSQLAKSQIFSSESFNISYKTPFFIDEDVYLNMDWYNLYRNNLVHVIPLPIKKDPESASEIIKNFLDIQTYELDLSGNSVLGNAMDYSVFWTDSFDDAVIENSPFYSQSGEQIGFVDLMKVRRNVRVAFSVSIFSEIVELPVSANPEYRMLVALIAEQPTNGEVIRMDNKTLSSILDALQEYGDVEVSIPRFELTSELDMKAILEDLGIHSLWADPEATKYISNPPAQPSSYIQRVSVNFNNTGLNPQRTEQTLEAAKEKFTANRPFIFAFYDALTYSNIFVGQYLQPTHY